ncbi:hypothetical protein AMJ40_05375 [candidate division TA06 bacterium DG_26]|uniref:Osmotically inducible protein OsmC n=1 Tax=candidate division TA06 bacterium DG_26 TaxID=1703771 RepID=A0A0S7WH56_UNCT6|nr:MAG: hypothetical protein AMJ40_05375 [candidate division TA06 bacterium DG_26]
MKATVKWVEGMQFQGIADSGHPVVMDSSPTSGGKDAGVRPMELVLIALGGCTGMDVVSILRKMRIEFDEFRIDIQAERAAEHPKVYRKIAMKYVIAGEDIPEEKLLRAIRLSEERYCSISAMLKKTSELKPTQEIVRKRRL